MFKIKEVQTNITEADDDVRGTGEFPEPLLQMWENILVNTFTFGLLKACFKDLLPSGFNESEKAKIV